MNQPVIPAESLSNSAGAEATFVQPNQLDVQVSTLVYPHEDIDTLAKFKSGREWARAAKIMGKHIPFVLLSMRASTVDGQIMTCTFLNGAAGAENLSRKYAFGELVNDLSYRAPRSLYVAAGTDANQIEDQTERGLPDQTSYFIKPVNGVQGRGTGHFGTAHDLAGVVSASHEDYLVQSDETPQEDWRYILHRDPHTTDKVWRIAYKKVRPSVMGDGTSTIGQLVRGARDIPDDRKSKIIHKIGERARIVPSSGHSTPVAESGNISNGAYGKLPEADEVHRMDGFMQQFVTDLEGRLGTRLNTMCFDMGVKDTAVFEGGYDFEKMKESVVFYEFQMPFGITGYLDELYSLDGSPLKKLGNFIRRMRLQTKLAKSALQSAIKSS